MAEESSFSDLIRRVRTGDERAARELLERYEPTLRTVIRVRLTDRSVRRVLDSMDICQSVLANFFVRVAAGQFELETPAQLVNLLAAMAQNKVINHVKYLQSRRRDVGRLQEGAEADECAAPGPSPSQAVANKELLKMVLDRLSGEERCLADQRAQGRSWEEIAAAVGGRPDALRVRLGRALDRVARELKLDR